MLQRVGHVPHGTGDGRTVVHTHHGRGWEHGTSPETQQTARQGHRRDGQAAKASAGAASPGAVGGCTDESPGLGDERGSGGRVLLRAQGRGRKGSGVRESGVAGETGEVRTPVQRWGTGLEAKGSCPSRSILCDLNRPHARPASRSVTPRLPHRPCLSLAPFLWPEGQLIVAPISLSEGCSGLPAGSSALRRLQG